MRKAFLEVTAEVTQGGSFPPQKDKGWKPQIWKNTLGMTMSALVRALLSECGDHGGAVAQQ